jgi:hypothetical protein
MDGLPSAATEELLAAFRDDLQRQLHRSAVVEHLFAREGDGMVSLAATVRVASDTFQIAGSGENVVTAYADLIQSAPAEVLGSAFRQLVGVHLGARSRARS